MSWDPIWQKVFESQEWGKYPPEELIRFVARNFYSVRDRNSVKMIELGCGPGANIWYLAREGFAAYGIDGSDAAIAQAERRLHGEKLSADLRVGDITALTGHYGQRPQFDAVIDVCCIQHNRSVDIRRIFDQINLILRPGGKFFAMLVAEGSYGSGTGKEIEPGTRVGITAGPLENMGQSHFFTISEVGSLFKSFEDLKIEYSLRSLNEMKEIYKHWVVTATKS